jgi:hypothetical protein
MVGRGNGRNAAAVATGSLPVMNRAILLIGLAVPLAACGSPTVDEKNASVEEVTEKVRRASDEKGLVNPGKWVSTVTIEDMVIPGMPAGAAEQMKRMAAQSHTGESCLTPEEARKPQGDFFGANDKCRYDHFTMGGGKIDAKMQCEDKGASQVMQMNGTYSPDAYTMRMTSMITNPSGPGTMTMKMKVEAKRVGPCTGKEA